AEAGIRDFHVTGVQTCALPIYNKISLDEVDAPPVTTQQESARLLTRQRMFGYTQETLRLLLAPMASEGQDPVGSMGTDTPLAVRSEERRVGRARRSRWDACL